MLLSNLYTHSNICQESILTCRSGPASVEPISVPGRMKKTAEEYPNEPAMKIRDVKTGQEVSILYFPNN